MALLLEYFSAAIPSTTVITTLTTVITTLIILVGSISILLLLLRNKSTTRSHSAGKLPPPGPWKLPVIGNIHQLIGGRAEILEYEIPSGTKVIINAWAIGRDPRCWQEADKFVPERFVDRPSDYTGNNLEFIPFGSGRRMCPGMSYGWSVVKLTLANMLYHFDWKLPSGITHENLDMTECFGVGVRRKHSLHLIPIAYDAMT